MMWELYKVTNRSQVLTILGIVLQSVRQKYALVRNISPDQKQYYREIQI